MSMTSWWTIFSRPIWQRPLRLAQFLLDLALIAIAFIMAYELRFDFSIPSSYQPLMWRQLPVMVLFCWGLYFISGCYRRAWRYVSLIDIPHFLLPFTIVAISLFSFRLTLPSEMQLLRLPISVILMFVALSFSLTLGMRVIWRAAVDKIEREVAWRERRQTDSTATDRTKRDGRTALIGAGRAGTLAARELRQRAVPDIVPVCFFDDDPRKQGQVISGLPVVGSISEIVEQAQKDLFSEVLITIDSRHKKELARIARICEDANLTTRVIPPLKDLLSGNVSISNIRPVSIEDLLGREEVKLDKNAISEYLRGKRVLVTGAGGSIGSELVRQIILFQPAKLVMLDQSEFALFEIDREMRQYATLAPCTPVLADICDQPRLQRVFDQHQPQVVFHAAAYKHVPLVESNSVEALDNNVLGTRALAESAGQGGVEVFVNISTDKAVNPTSVMGASKRLAEILVQDLTRAYPDTRFESVRFGNVLGSTGSVIPLFKEQIAKGGPVQVTDPEMRRYFMTIPEAAQLVLQSAAMGQGGEIFILDMGEPVKIIDLARDLIRLSGLVPETDIKIEIVGLRPGEKLFEELSTDAENTARTRHPKVFIGNPVAYEPETVVSIVQDIREIVKSGNQDEVQCLLKKWLPEFRKPATLES